MLRQFHRRPSSCKYTLDWLYPIPNPFRDYESYVRFYHLDLANLGSLELHRERERVRWRLVMDHSPGSWLVERLQAIEATIHAAR